MNSTEYNSIVRIKQFFKILVNHKVVKNVSYLTIGNITAQLVSLVGAFYIPRLLGPENYGIYNSVTAYIGLFGIFTFSGINRVIIREAAKAPQKTKEILESTIGIKHIFTLIGVILALIIVLFINYEYGTKIYIAIYSISLLFTSTEGVIQAIFFSHQSVKIVGAVSVVRQLFRVPISIALLLWGYGVRELIILHLIIEIFVTYFLYRFSKRIVTFNFFSRVKILKQYFFSGVRFSLLDFLGMLSGKIDIFMLSLLTTPDKVGIYALAYRLVKKGLILRAPISQSLFPYYSNKFSQEKPRIGLLTKHSFLLLILVSLFIIPSLFVIEPIIKTLVGTQFIESANIFTVLVFYLLMNFTIIPWGLALHSTSNEKYSLIVVSISAILNIILNIILFKQYNIIGIAYSTLIVEVLRLFLTVIFVNKNFN